MVLGRLSGSLRYRALPFLLSIGGFSVVGVLGGRGTVCILLRLLDGFKGG